MIERNKVRAKKNYQKIFTEIEKEGAECVLE